MGVVEEGTARIQVRDIELAGPEQRLPHLYIA
jgi:hypothetical protein